MFPEAVIGESETVPGVGRAEPVLGLLVERERLLAVGDGAGVLVNRVAPAEGVERRRLAEPVVGAAGQRQRLPGVRQCRAGVALDVGQPGEVQVGAGLPRAVAGLVVPGHRAPEVMVGRTEPAVLDVGQREVAVGQRLGAWIIAAVRDRDRDGLHGGEVVPLREPAEQGVRAWASCPAWASKLCATASSTAASSTRCSMVNQANAARWSGNADASEGRGGGSSGCQPGSTSLAASRASNQVVVEHPPADGATVGRTVERVCQLLPVGAEQIVTTEAVGGRLGQQVRSGQLVERRPDPLRWRPGEAGRRRRADVRGGVQADLPEQSGRVSAEQSVRPGEHGAHVGGGIVGGQGGEPTPARRQIVGDGLERKRGPGGGSRGHDGQGQWQPRGTSDQLVHRCRLGGGPLRTQSADE